MLLSLIAEKKLYIVCIRDQTEHNKKLERVKGWQFLLYSDMAPVYYIFFLGGGTGEIVK